MILLSSDFDGTYDTSIFNIRVNNIQLKEFTKNGNIFMLNTGRGFKSAKVKTDEYKIPYQYLAVGDGTALYDAKDNPMYFKVLDRNMRKNFLAFADNNGLENIDFLYPSEYSRKFYDNRDIGSVSITIEEKDFSKEIRESFEALEKKHPNYEFSIYYGVGVVYLGVKPPRVSKSFPIEFIKALKGIHHDNVFTIGDELNDVEMVRDYHGFHVGKNSRVKEYSLGEYRSVYQLVEDINKKKVKRRK